MTRELVEYIIKQLVNHPDDVRVELVKAPEGDLLEIFVHEQDRGKVIGKSGQTVKALRMLVGAVVSDDKRVMVDLSKQ